MQILAERVPAEMPGLFAAWIFIPEF